MKRKAAVAAAGILLLALAPGGAAGAPEPPRPLANRTLELFVKGAGGSYEIGVHPDVVTVLYLPELVTKVFASDQKKWELHPVASTVAVRPKPGEADNRGTVSINTASLHLALVMKLVPFDEARAQVFFRREDQPILDAQCLERLDVLGRQVTDAKAGLAGQVETRAHAMIARSIAQAVATSRARGNTIARNEAGIVLWAETVAHFGDDVWVRLGLENRSRTPFAVGDVEVQTALAPQAAAAGWERGEVGFNERVFGAVRIPRGGDGKVPRVVSILVREPRVGRDVRLADLKLDPE